MGYWKSRAMAERPCTNWRGRFFVKQGLSKSAKTIPAHSLMRPAIYRRLTNLPTRITAGRIVLDDGETRRTAPTS